MENPAVTSAPDAATSGDTADGTNPETGSRDTTAIEAELLVEEISIDGMCGVY